MFRFCLIWIWWCNTAYAAFEPFPKGSGVLGIGGCRTTSTDVWSTANNPAASAWVTQGQAGFFAQNTFGINTLNTAAFSALLKQHWGCPGLHLYRTGINSYSEQQVSLSYGKKLHPAFSIGIAMGYGFIHSIYGLQDAFTVQAGLFGRLSPEMDIGFQVFNPNRAKLRGAGNEYVATLVSLGICYKAGKQVRLYIECESNLVQPAGIAFGLAYKPADILQLRLGYCTQPAQLGFGVGVSLKKFKADSGAAFHPLLGPSPHLSLCFP